jgi:hypothetical protein
LEPTLKSIHKVYIIFSIKKETLQALWAEWVAKEVLYGCFGIYCLFCLAHTRSKFCRHKATEPILTEGGRQERKLQAKSDQDITILEQ